MSVNMFTKLDVAPMCSCLTTLCRWKNLGYPLQKGTKTNILTGKEAKLNIMGQRVKLINGTKYEKRTRSGSREKSDV